jgi:hypothetical protein
LIEEPGNEEPLAVLAQLAAWMRDKFNVWSKKIEFDLNKWSLISDTIVHILEILDSLLSDSRLAHDTNQKYRMISIPNQKTPSFEEGFYCFLHI